MRARIGSLEDALRALQSSVSDDPHPLLLTNGSAMDSTNDAQVSGPSSDPSPIPGPPLTREDEEFLDAFGEFIDLFCLHSIRYVGPRYAHPWSAW